MRIAFLTPAVPLLSTEALMTAAVAAGHEVVRVHGPEDVALGVGADVAWWRPATDWYRHRTGEERVARTLAALGTPFVVEPEAVALSFDKWASSVCIATAGIDQPTTWPYGSAIDPQPSVAAPYIVKPAYGSLGRDILLARSPGALYALATRLGEDAVVQEFLPGARCIRVIAGRESVVCAYEKVSDDPLVKAISQGATRVEVHVDEVIERLACGAVRALSTSACALMGIDLLVSGDRTVFLEANPHFAFGADSGIADACVAHLAASQLEASERTTAGAPTEPTSATAECE